MVKGLKNEKGQALVEFAVVLPILLLIILGIVQFGMMLNSYLSITNAVREGARAGIMGSNNTEIRDKIIATSPSLDATKLSLNISPAESSRISGDTLTVTINYNYDLTVPIISSLFNNVIVLKAETSMRIE